jgi:hypothetical protein
MEKFKTFTILLLIVVVVLAVLLIIGKKQITYVCYDGTEQQELKKCPAVPALTIDVKKATEAINNYARAYASSKSDTYSIVNVYRNGSLWQTEVLFSSIKTKEVHSVNLDVDGKTATVTCITGCDYLGLGVQVNTTTNTTNSTTP